ncbi:MAG TPA: hypothetical protein VMH31_03685 [Methylomirabilota bacterium]|nr:hypothetical protein [Methylomirabilota bacterium]
MLAAWSAPACEQMACCKKGQMCPAHAKHSPKNKKSEKPAEMPCAHHAKAVPSTAPAAGECAMSACCPEPEGPAVVPALGKMILAKADQLARQDSATRVATRVAASEASGHIVPPFEPPRA